MGACGCSCLSDKQKPIEGTSEIVKSLEKQEKSTQSENISILTEISPREVPKPSQLSIDSPDPSHLITRLQALYRGHLARKAYANHKSMQPQPLSEVPSSISTYEARLSYSKLAPFKFDRPSGDDPVTWKGPTKLLDGSVYIGEWGNKGTPHGKGIMYYIDGGICEGYWLDGKLHDKGRRVSPNGDVYTGCWSHGKMQGQGVMEYATTSGYNGEWMNNKHHGFGTETWTDGSMFEGYYKEGLKDGKGKFFWADGTRYEGDFSNDVIQGFGKYVWANREYEGFWKDGKMHGKGIFRWKDGKIYEGEYVDDIKEGFGVLRWPDGKSYEGMWKAGKYHGKGILIMRGKKRKGIWENGEFKQKIRED